MAAVHVRPLWKLITRICAAIVAVGVIIAVIGAGVAMFTASHNDQCRKNHNCTSGLTAQLRQLPASEAGSRAAIELISNSLQSTNETLESRRAIETSLLLQIAENTPHPACALHHLQEYADQIEAIRDSAAVSASLIGVMLAAEDTEHPVIAQLPIPDEGDIAPALIEIGRVEGALSGLAPLGMQIQSECSQP